MLTRLAINDVVVIDKLALNLSAGLNVFTGETGAGKSILLDALGLALGERGEAGLVRKGAAQAGVTAEFSLISGHAAFVLAEQHGLTIDDALILRRILGKDGKSRAFINDQSVGVGLLKQFGETLLEIHGQFETHGLLNPAAHRGILDAFGDLNGLKRKTGAAFKTWKEAEDSMRNADAARARAAAESEFLRAAVDELDELAPEAGEADKLAERRTGLQHREKIVEALRAAGQALGDDRGAGSFLAQAGKAMARVADKAAELQNLLSAIDNAANETAEALTRVERALAGIDAEADGLQRIEERLFALKAAARKHQVDPGALPEVRLQLQERLDLLTGEHDRLGMLNRQAQAAKNAYAALAAELRAERERHAAKLQKAVDRELPPLKLERARFKIEVTPLPEGQWSAEGSERVTFMASTNPGTEPGPLHKIASGGELARFMLALKVVLAESDPVPTLVFDEVDAGVGGATAAAVGERLLRLASFAQILVVTHSPQVAARGTAHLKISKQIKNKMASTQVEYLDAGAKREEIARMLAGNEVTEAARQAAASLIGDDQTQAARRHRDKRRQ